MQCCYQEGLAITFFHWNLISFLEPYIRDPILNGMNLLKLGETFSIALQVSTRVIPTTTPPSFEYAALSSFSPLCKGVRATSNMWWDLRSITFWNFDQNIKCSIIHWIGYSKYQPTKNKWSYHLICMRKHSYKFPWRISWIYSSV